MLLHVHSAEYHLQFPEPCHATPREALGFVVLSLVVRVSTVLMEEKGSDCVRNY